MEASTNIQSMLSDSFIFVPNYQRAYSWDQDKQVSVFLSDIEQYVKSSSKSKYYFGHFLFEKVNERKYGVVDGQQRLTTIVIFLSALYEQLKLLRPLTEEELFEFNSMIKLASRYRFSTVDYDNQLFKEYVIDRTKKDKIGLRTESEKRIVAAYDYFAAELSKKSEEELLALYSAVKNASCSTYIVENESDAIQMFIFQNNRGKKPTNLEIIKAQFMFNVHLYGGEETDNLLSDIKNRFENIYRSISRIERKVNEDDILVYTQRVYFNNLYEGNALAKVDEELAKDSRLDFIKGFTQGLSNSFNYLESFFTEDYDNNYSIHSIISLRSHFDILMPYVIKAYSFGLNRETIGALCASLETLFVRQLVIRRSAVMSSRLNGVYQRFSGDITETVDLINWLKDPNDWWFRYWDDAQFEEALNGGIERGTAVFLLWKYENSLLGEGKSGYDFIRFDSIPEKHLEHIAPQTKTVDDTVSAGYCEYDDEFYNQFLNCLGNYLLLSGHHNESISNGPFANKRATYTQLLQQREIQDMTPDIVWDKERISNRLTKIKAFIRSIY